MEMDLRTRDCFFKLKEALLAAPALVYPRKDKPFIFQLATTSMGLSAILFQELGSGIKPVAYASKALSNVETKFSTCEKVVLTLLQALRHWEYLIGMAPVVLRTCHSPINYILSGKINDSRVSNPRLANSVC